MLFHLDAGVFFGLICLNGCGLNFDLDLVRWVGTWLGTTAQIGFSFVNKIIDRIFSDRILSY